MAVFNKAADAGGIREDDLDKMKDKVDLSQIKIVGYSDYFPNWPVYATPKLNKDAAAKVRAALLKLKPKETESEKILGAAKLTGFATITDKDYDLLRQAAKLVGHSKQITDSAEKEERSHGKTLEVNEEILVLGYFSPLS